MKVTVTEISPLKRSMEVIVDADTVEQAYAKAFKDALKQLALPGFRRGKVPAYMGRKYIPNSMLKRDVLEVVVPQAFREALEQEKIESVSQPDLRKWSVERGEELTFTAELEVIPTIDIKNYDGVEVTQERYTPTESDVDEAIERTRNGRAVLKNVEDRGLQANDIAFVDYESFEDGKPVKDGKAENFPMELVPANYIPGFLENIYGMKPGESREFDAEFPEEHKSVLAGHKIHFAFHLKEIKERVLPEVNEEFVKAVSNFETVEELRKNIMELMTNRAQREADQGIAEKVYFAIAPQVTPDLVPEGLVEFHAREFNGRVVSSLKAQNRTLDQMLREQGLNKEGWENHCKLMGKGEARLEIIVKNLARILNITVDDEEIDSIIDQEAARAHQTTASLRRQMERAGVIESLRYSVLRDKVTQHLVDNAKVNYVAPKTPEERAAELAAQKQKAENAETSEAEGENASGASVENAEVKETPAAEEPVVEKNDAEA